MKNKLIKKKIVLATICLTMNISYIYTQDCGDGFTYFNDLFNDFPDWALTRAWKQQGLEVINWLQEAVDK